MRPEALDARVDQATVSDLADGACFNDARVEVAVAPESEVAR